MSTTIVSILVPGLPDQSLKAFEFSSCSRRPETDWVSGARFAPRALEMLGSASLFCSRAAVGDRIHRCITYVATAAPN